MSGNPISLVRFWGNAVLVAVVVVAIAGMILSPAYWTGWAWVIGAVAMGYAALSFAVHLRFPDKAGAAWDEQNLAAHRASLAFGYWATLAAFLLLLGAVWADLIDPRAAFFWLGPVLGIAPAVHYLASVLRNRAE